MKISREKIFWNIQELTAHNKIAFKLFFGAYISFAVQKDSLLKLMLSVISSNSVIYDIGSYVGVYSISLHKIIDNSFIYAFEPNPTSFSALERNIQLLDLKSKILPYNTAIGPTRNKTDFHISSYGPRSSFYSQNAEYAGNKIIKIQQVDCIDLDSLVSLGICKPPNFIKVDTEGYELEVLQGAKNTLSTLSPQIFIEPHGDSAREDIKNYLKQFGYSFKDVGYLIRCYKESAC
jgi:FkbM family methyltransferase